MHEQHVQHESQLEAILVAAAALRRRPDDPARRAALAAIAEKLEPALEEHLRLDESLVFPAVREHMPASMQDEVVQELRARRGARVG